MRLDYLGDALDHFKGSLFRRLREAGLLENLAVDPMATDAEQWTDDAYRLYSDLLGVDPRNVLKTQATLDKTGRRTLGLPGHTGDLFLDPDTGVRTGSQSTARKYVLPEEVGPLLVSSRLLLIYQHAWRAGEDESVRKAVTAIRLREPVLAATAYTSRQVAMVFFSKDSKRISAVASWLRTWLGAKHQRVYEDPGFSRSSRAALTLPPS